MTDHQFLGLVIAGGASIPLIGGIVTRRPGDAVLAVGLMAQAAGISLEPIPLSEYLRVGGILLVASGLALQFRINRSVRSKAKPAGTPE